MFMMNKIKFFLEFFIKKGGGGMFFILLGGKKIRYDYKKRGNCIIMTKLPSHFTKIISFF